VGVGVAIVCRLSDRLTLGRVGDQARASPNTLFLKAMMKPTFVAGLALLMLRGSGSAMVCRKDATPSRDVDGGARRKQSVAWVGAAPARWPSDQRVHVCYFTFG
jgi:hypothetical protein